EALGHGLDIVVSFAVVTALFALIYRYMPDVRIEWHDVWIGAAVTALLFTIGKFAIGLYIGKSSAASSFGAAGSLAVLLLWVYYSAQIFLFGAEFTAAFSHAYGSRRSAPGARVAEAAASGRPASEPAGVPSAVAAAQAAEPVVAKEEESRLVRPIHRHPVRAIGLAAVLGAAVALLVRRRASSRKPVRAMPVVARAPT